MLAAIHSVCALLDQTFVLEVLTGSYSLCLCVLAPIRSLSICLRASPIEGLMISRHSSSIRSIGLKEIAVGSRGA